MANVWSKIQGEISKLRGSFYNYLGWGLAGSWTRPYSLDSGKVDYQRARELYENTNEDYKLGAGFAKPVVNNAAAFLGVPSFQSEDDEAKQVLNDFKEKNRSKMFRTTKNALKEADAYVWLTREENKENSLFPEEKNRIVYNIIPPDMVHDIVLDPVTGEPQEYILQSNHTWKDNELTERTFTQTQRIRAGAREVRLEGDPPPDMEVGEFTLPWDFVPIVHFKNEADAHHKYGKSELEPIEPFMKSYHDVMMHAITGSKLHSTPKMKLKTGDVKSFLKNNFGVTDPATFAKQGGKIDIENRDALILGAEDDAGFMEVNSATGDAQLLLKLLFYCIVDTSETPEFVFGVHMPSSLSSVEEQMPVLARKINRKREQFTDPWQRMARIVLAMTASSENKTFETFSAELDWEEVDPRDSKEVVDEVNTMVGSLVRAVEGGIMSIDAAVDKLSEYVDTMEKYEGSEGSDTKEKDRLMRTKLTMQGLEDNQLLQQQRQQIQNLQGGRTS